MAINNQKANQGTSTCATSLGPLAIPVDCTCSWAGDTEISQSRLDYTNSFPVLSGSLEMHTLRICATNGNSHAPSLDYTPAFALQVTKITDNLGPGSRKMLGTTCVELAACLRAAETSLLNSIGP